MDWQRTEGIVMQVTPFQDSDAIFTVYTPDLGFAKFVLKYALSSRQRSKGVPSPLTLTEFIYRRGGSELYSCKEATLLEPYTYLRNNLKSLGAAGSFLQSLRSSQPLGKVAEPLYRLLLAYLDRLPLMEDPRILSSSLKLKILRYEGVLAFTNKCSVCVEGLNDVYIGDGEFFCNKHHPENSFHFSSEDGQLFFVMGLAQSLSDLKLLAISDNLENKVNQIFEMFVR